PESCRRSRSRPSARAAPGSPTPRRWRARSTPSSRARCACWSRGRARIVSSAWSKRWWGNPRNRPGTERMLYWLAKQLTPHYSGFNVFSYLTVRSIFAVITALAIGLLLGPWMIDKLKFGQIGQVVRDDGPKTHFSKAGTPTMGGMLILVAIFASTLLWADLGNRFVWVVLGVTFCFGLIGFWDDYLKLAK